jgi:hypothetical protein
MSKKFKVYAKKYVFNTSSFPFARYKGKKWLKFSSKRKIEIRVYLKILAYKASNML